MELREPAYLSWRHEVYVFLPGHHVAIFIPSPNGVQLSVTLPSARGLPQALPLAQDLYLQASPFEGASAQAARW